MKRRDVKPYFLLATFFSLLWPVPLFAFEDGPSIRAFTPFALAAWLWTPRTRIKETLWQLKVFGLIPLMLLSLAVIHPDWSGEALSAMINSLLLSSVALLLVANWSFEEIISTLKRLFWIPATVFLSIFAGYLFVVLGRHWETDWVLWDRFLYRLIFPLSDPNFVGLSIIPFFLLYAYTAKGREHLATLAMGLTLVVTFSASAFLSILIPLVITGALWRNRLSWAAFATLPWLLLLHAMHSAEGYRAVKNFFAKIMTGSDRFTLWKETVYIFFESPFWGHGWAAGPSKIHESIGHLKPPHNFILDFALSGGVFALIVLALFLAKPMVAAWHSFFSKKYLIFHLLVSTLLMSCSLSVYFSPLLVLVSALCFLSIDPQQGRKLETIELKA